MIENFLDNASEKMCCFLLSKRILKESNWKDFDYEFRCFLFLLIVFIPLLLINWFIGILLECIIISIVFNLIRECILKNNYHTDLSNCFKLSITYITIWSYIAHLISVFFYFNEIIVSVICGIISAYIMSTNIGHRFFNWFIKFLQVKK